MESGRMIRIERRQKILEYLRVNGSMRLSDAVSILNASPATVRRDFIMLSRDGLIQRDHGGISAGPKLNQPQGWVAPYQWRLQVELEAKKRIAQAATSLLKEGDSMFIDGGTTTLQMASLLPRGVRVITHSLMLASSLCEIAAHNNSMEIFLAGGAIIAQLGLLCGPQAVDTVQNYHPNWAFISTAGIIDNMIMNNIEQEVTVERAMMQNAGKVALLADHTKMGKKALVRMCDIQEVDVLITNRESPREYIDAIRAAGVECILA